MAGSIVIPRTLFSGMRSWDDGVLVGDIGAPAGMRSLAARGGGGSSFPTPMFQVDYYDGNVTPEIGSGGTFARASTMYYADSLTSLSSVASGNPAIEAFPFNGAGSEGGLQMMGPHANWILRSEELDNAAWSDVGAPTTGTNDGTAPDGNATADSITANGNNEGRTQSSAVAAASTRFVFSIYLKRNGASNVACTLTLAGTGATPETTTQAATATSSWQRFYVYQSFTAAATGNATVTITVDTNGESVYAWGAQLEQTEQGTYGSLQSTPTCYIKTVAATAGTATESLSYPSSNITTLSTGSICFWMNPTWSDQDYTTSGRYHIAVEMTALTTLLAAFTTHNSTSTWKAIFYFGGTLITSLADTQTISRNTWSHWVFAWDNTGAAIDFEIYQDGTSVKTNTTATPTTPSAGTVWVGTRDNGTFQGGLRGEISGLKWYDVRLDDTQVTTLYNSEKSNYGL